MTKRLIILLMLVFYQDISLVLMSKIRQPSKSSDDEFQERRRKVIEHLVRHSEKNLTALLVGHELVTQKIILDIKQFGNYGDVSTFSFNMKADVSIARFTFQSAEVNMNTIGNYEIGHCNPQKVIVSVKRGSYPAVNPDYYQFPKHFIPSSSREKIHTVEMFSNGKSKHYSIQNPKPGTWYVIVYIEWKDPRTQKIQQQGIGADCLTILYADLQVKLVQNVQLIDCYTELIIEYADLPYNSKCLIADSIEPINLRVSLKNDNIQSIIVIRVQALRLSTEKEYLVACAFESKLYSTQVVTFSPYPNALHYIHIDRISDNSRYTNCELYKFRSDLEESDVNHSVFDLMRRDEGIFATFEYRIPEPDIKDTSSFINLKYKEIKSARFLVNHYADTGGNLVIKASLQRSLSHYLGSLTWADESLGFINKNHFYKAVICLDFGFASIPLETGHCKFNKAVKEALFILNSTDTESVFETSIIPYPDSGKWYLTLRCFIVDIAGGLNRTSYNDTNEHVRKKKQEVLLYEEEKNNIATVILLVSSMACIDKGCSDHGSCKTQTNNFALSFCSCVKGYGGWDCSDSSRMDSKWLSLLAILLLTLSNALFLISIYAAIIRNYYTEAIMYSFTMVFSTFYHACDAPQLVAYCIYEKIFILQFSDFLAGILCFWVTLLAMSIITEELRTTLQLTGAVIIAILTAWDRHSLCAFAVPVVIGSVILILSWFWDRRLLGIWRYPKNYYIIFLPIGLILCTTGLVCFAFFQTEENYKIVHSLWHGVVALSVAFLLPDSKREGDRNPFLASRNFCRLRLLRMFNSWLKPRKVEPIQPEVDK